MKIAYLVPTRSRPSEGGLEIIAPRSTMGFGLRFMGGGQ